MYVWDRQHLQMRRNCILPHCSSWHQHWNGFLTTNCCKSSYMCQTIVCLQRRELESLPAAARGPLYGIPFGVKDNIDVAGLPTTAACDAYRYIPTESAPTVQTLVDAGEPSHRPGVQPLTSMCAWKVPKSFPTNMHGQWCCACSCQPNCSAF